MCVIFCYSPEKKDQVEALLYCMDSNDYQPNKIYGAYTLDSFRPNRMVQKTK